MAGSISTLGVGSGLKLQDIIDQLRAVDQKVVDRKKTDIARLESQRDEFTTINNKLLTVKSAALELSLSGTFIGRTVSSSAEDAMTATVTDGATVKSSVVAVTRLAQQSSWMSSAAQGVLNPATDSIASETTNLTIQVGTKISTLSVAAGTTMNQLVELINNPAGNPGVSAAIVNDGLDPLKPYKLVLTANGYGEDNRIEILSQPALLGLAEQASQTAVSSLNAQFTVDGIAFQRQSNTVNDVLSGVTLAFKKTDTSTISVAENDEALKEKVTSLVTAYNDVVQELRQKSAYDATTGDFGILAGTTLRDLPFELQGLFTAGNTADPEGVVTSLFDLGMEFNRDGSITIDETALSAAISDHGEGVRAFFLGDAENSIEGLADKINNRLRSLTSVAGSIEGEKTSAQTRIDDLNLKLEEETARLDRRYEQLTKQFVALDSFMSQMTSMSNFLTGQFNSLSDGWVNSSKD